MENIFYGIPFRNDFSLSIENQKRLAFLLFTSLSTTPDDALQIVNNNELINKMDLLIKNLQLEIFTVTSCDDNFSIQCSKSFEEKFIPKLYDWVKKFKMPSDEELEIALNEFKISRIQFDSLFRKYRATKLNSPSQIREYISESVIGQDEAVSVMATTIHQYQLRLIDGGIAQTSPLFIGETGTGKDLLLKQSAEILGIPVVPINAPSIVPEGIVGVTLTKELRNAHKLSESDKFVIYINEVDKICKNYHQDGFKPSIMNEILRLYDGTINIFRGSEQYDTEKKVEIDLKKCLIITSGAFQGIENHIYTRLTKEFNNNKALIDTQNIMAYINAIDLQSYGMLPELTSRMSYTCHLSKLNVNSIYSIMTESCDSDLKKHIHSLNKQGVNITFTEKAIWTIAEQVYTQNVGARYINAFLSRLLKDVYLYPEKHTEIIIDEQFVQYHLTSYKYRQLFNHFQTSKPDLLKIAENLSLDINFVLDNYFLYKQFIH